MNSPKKIVTWISGCFVVLVIFVSVLILFSNSFINQASIKNRIQSEISRALNGQVQFQRLELSFFPRFRLVAHQSRFSIPETVQGTLSFLTVYPKVSPLFTGKLQIAGIDLSGPDVEIQLPDKQVPENRKQETFSLEGVKENVGAVLRVISSKAPGLDLLVENGRLNFLKENKSVLKLKNIHSLIDFADHSVNLDLRCKIEPWGSIVFKGNLRLNEVKSAFTLAELKLDASGLNLSGKLEFSHLSKPPAPSIALELKSNHVDISAARKIALAQAGHIPVARDIFNILKAGKLPFITFNSHGNSIEELGKLENILIKGRMQEGQLFIPKVNLDLTHVSGDVTISKGILHGEGLEARLGNTLAENATLQMGLAGENALFRLNLPVVCDLRDLPLILKHVAGDTTVAKELALMENLQGSGKGKIVLGEHFGSLETRVDVSQFNLSANYRRLPYLLTVNNGQLSYKGDTIVLDNLSGSMGKSFFSGLSLAFDFKNAPYLEVKSGRSTLSMDEIYPWLASLDTLKEKLQKFKTIQGVLSLANFSGQGPVSQPEKWRLEAAGDLALNQGMNISVDMAVHPGELNIKKLVIKDRKSHATARLDYKNRAFKFFYNGKLNKTTLDNLLKENQFLGGWIKGNFHGHALLDQPVKSIVQGNLQIKDLKIPWEKKDLWVVNNLVLQADKNKLRVETADLSSGGSRLDLKGNVNNSVNGIEFDMDLSANNLNIDQVKQMLNTKKKDAQQRANQKIKIHSLRGHLKLKTKTLTYEGLTWNPFYADVTVNDDTTTVAVTQANICGIAMPGTLDLSPREIHIAVQPVVHNQRLQSTVNCLMDKSIKVDGNFNFDGDITAQGFDEARLGSLNGNFKFDAGAGRFYSGQFHGILVSIVRLLSITEIFRGQLPDIGKEGFGFNSINMKADIQNGKIILNEMIIDGTSMNIAGQGSIDLTSRQVDCVALVAPLKTADAIVNKIPLVRDIMGGSFISIPVAINGDLEHPEVTPLSPSAVGSGLLGMMKRTLQLPVRIIQIVLPGKEEKK